VARYSGGKKHLQLFIDGSEMGSPGSIGISEYNQFDPMNSEHSLKAPVMNMNNSRSPYYHTREKKIKTPLNNFNLKQNLKFDKLNLREEQKGIRHERRNSKKDETPKFNIADKNFNFADKIILDKKLDLRKIAKGTTLDLSNINTNRLGEQMMITERSSRLESSPMDQANSRFNKSKKNGLSSKRNKRFTPKSAKFKLNLDSQAQEIQNLENKIK